MTDKELPTIQDGLGLREVSDKINLKFIKQLCKLIVHNKLAKHEFQIKLRTFVSFFAVLELVLRILRRPS